MHENLDLILTLTGCLAAALFLGYLTQRAGLSPIVGYLLAGIVVGKNTPGFAANENLASQMAEIGVILLMFGVGLHFQFSHLLAVRRIAIPGAIVQSLAATALGCVVALGFGWSWPAGITFGLAISVASTVVLLRVLSDANDLHTPTGHIAIGWLIVEDLFTVVVLVLLPALFGSAQSPGTAVPGIFIPLAFALFKITLLVIFIIFAGGRAIPWLLGRVADTRSRELFTLTVLVVALGIAVGSAKLFGVSMALGAFLAGMVVGRSEFSSRAASDALPMRDAFAVLFFVSVGMLFDPRSLLESPALFAATLAIILIGKPLAALAIVLLLRYPLRIALAVAVALAQIGEFSFILASLGEELKILPRAATAAIVAAAIVSISLNPALYWMLNRPVVNRCLARWSRLFAAEPVESVTPERAERSSAVVVGYGPVGRTLVRLLRENDIEPTVIELNRDTIHQLREQGVRAVYGDASHHPTAVEAGIDRAVALILSSSSTQGSEEVIRVARQLNPKVRVLARAAYLRDVPPLRKAGADVVFAAEGEVALTMTEILLRDLGATAEQIDRERARVREELFES